MSTNTSTKPWINRLHLKQDLALAGACIFCGVVAVLGYAVERIGLRGRADEDI